MKCQHCQASHHVPSHVETWHCTECMNRNVRDNSAYLGLENDRKELEEKLIARLNGWDRERTER